jgi:hypothetical protein
MSAWTSRKLWVAIGFQTLWAAMTVHGTLDGTNLEFLTLVTLGGFFGANVGEHWAQGGRR